MTETTLTAEDFGAPVPIADLVRELLPNHPWGKAFLFDVLRDAGYTVDLPPTDRGYIGAIAELPAADAAHVRGGWTSLVEQHRQMTAARRRRVDETTGQSGRFD